MEDSAAAAALAYILSSFLLPLNTINHTFNHLIHCDLISQVLIGLAYGTPDGAKWLDTSTEQSIVQLGWIPRADSPCI